MKIKKYITIILCTVTISFSGNLWGNLIDNCFFSDKGYASYIKIYGWVVTEDQVAEAFTKQKDPIPLPCQDLSGQHTYFLIRLENLKALRAWGTLSVECPGIGSTSINVFTLSPLSQRGEYYAIPLAKMYFSNEKKDKIPKLLIKWKKLYTQ